MDEVLNTSWKKHWVFQEEKNMKEEKDNESKKLVWISELGCISTYSQFYYNRCINPLMSI